MPGCVLKHKKNTMTLFENNIWRANPQLHGYVNCINMHSKQVSVCDVERVDLLATIKDCIITPLPLALAENAIERAYVTLVLFDPTKHESERTMYCTSTYTIWKCEDMENENENNFEYVCKFDNLILPTKDGKFGEREYFA